MELLIISLMTAVFLKMMEMFKWFFYAACIIAGIAAVAAIIGIMKGEDDDESED